MTELLLFKCKYASEVVEFKVDNNFAIGLDMASLELLKSVLLLITIDADLLTFGDKRQL